MRIVCMRIAFDLDDTIIRGRIPFPLEPLPSNRLARFFCKERIRAGCIRLMNDLRDLNHDVWIYTTSFRDPFWTRMMFRAYGTKIARMINQYEHERTIKKMAPYFRHCSKLPPAFGIDLLIDECGGVLAESQRFNFDVVQVDPNDDSWDDKVRRMVLGS